MSDPIESNTGFRYDGKLGQWVSFSTDKQVNVKRIRIASYNVLFELHDEGQLFTKERYSELDSRMKDLFFQKKLHLIGFQEVTQPFLQTLLSWDWVRKNFITSHVSIPYQEYEQIILSRIPFTSVAIYPISTKKKILIVQINGGSDFGSISISNVHLTSNAHQNQRNRRFEQLNQVFSLMKKFSRHHNIIMGDFNSRDESELDHIQHAGFIDAWKIFHPNDSGFTFDPKTNPTAKLTSKSGLSRRFDKFLLRSNLLTPKSIEIFGKDWEFTINEKSLNCSDHYGLLFSMKLE